MSVCNILDEEFEEIPTYMYNEIYGIKDNKDKGNQEDKDNAKSSDLFVFDKVETNKTKPVKVNSPLPKNYLNPSKF